MVFRGLSKKRGAGNRKIRLKVKFDIFTMENLILFLI
jgi:hypothetical protein